MPLDPRAKRFLDRLAALNPPSALSLSVPERRVALEHMLAFSGASATVGAVDDRLIPGSTGAIRVRIYSPPGAGDVPLAGLVYFHGGGLVAGSLESHDGICRSLCSVSHCRVLSVDYRLAPEHRFPAAVTDGIEATSYIAAHGAEFGVDSALLGISGDSAGATLAAVVGQHLALEKRIPLALQLLICPIMDLTAQTDSRRAFAEGYLIDESTLAHDLLHYIDGKTDPADPRVSPLLIGDVTGLPPTCIHTAEFDPLRDEGRLYAERLMLAGVPTRYTCHQDMIHLFYGMGKLIPYATTAWNLIGSDVRAMFASA